MRIGLLVFFIACLMLIQSLAVFAQSNGDYRSARSGNWNAVSSWQMYNGGWGAATTTPDSSVGKVEILAGHTITITANVVVDSVFVDSLATLVVNTGDTVTVGPPYGLTQAGIVINGGGVMTVKGAYRHARDGGSIPTTTWANGSTCIITGTTANSPSNANQNFYNFVWNCRSQSANASVGWRNNTIGGTVTNLSSNHKWLQLTAQTGTLPRTTITINGDVISYDSTTATASALTDTITVIVKGNFNNAAGTFQLASGSGASCNWLVKGNVTISGSSFSTNTTTTLPDSLIFCGVSQQNYIKSGAITSLPYVRIDVRNGAILNLDTNKVGNGLSQTFTVDSGSTLITAHASGLKGNLNNTSRGSSTTLSTKANYVFDGTVAQVVDTLIPAIVGGLTLNASAGIIIQKHISVTGLLTLGGNASYTNLNYLAGYTGLAYTASVVQTTGSELRSSLTNIIINNTQGVTLSATDTIIGTLALTSGTLTTGANKLVVISGGTVSRTSGYVIGNLQKNLVVGDSTAFEVGTANGYSPVIVKAVIGSGNVTVKAVQGSHPNTFDTTKTALRYWTLMGDSAITKAKLKFYFLAADVRGQRWKYGAWQYSGSGTSWTPLISTVDINNHFVNVPDVTYLSSDWTLGESSLSTMTSVESQGKHIIPRSFSVSQNYPNPFNPTTTISYQLLVNSQVTLKVYDVLGREVATLVNEMKDAGYYLTSFDGSKFSSGVYLARFVVQPKEGNPIVQVKKMLLMK